MKRLLYHLVLFAETTQCGAASSSVVFLGDFITISADPTNPLSKQLSVPEIFDQLSAAATLHGGPDIVRVFVTSQGDQAADSHIGQQGGLNDPAGNGILRHVNTIATTVRLQSSGAGVPPYRNQLGAWQCRGPNGFLRVALLLRKRIGQGAAASNFFLFLPPGHHHFMLVSSG